MLVNFIEGRLVEETYYQLDVQLCKYGNAVAALSTMKLGAKTGIRRSRSVYKSWKASY